MYRKSSQGWLKHLDFMLLDLLSLQVAFMAAYIIRHGWASPYANREYRGIAMIVTLIDIVVIVFFSSLKNVLKRGYYKEFAVTVKQACLVELILTFYLFSVQESAVYSRVTLYLMGGIYVVFAYVMRLLWKCHLRRNRSAEGSRALLIVTSDDQAAEVVENVRSRNYGAYQITGLVISNRDLLGETIAGIKVVANMENVAEYVCREWVDEVFIGLPQQEQQPEELINRFEEMGVVVHIELARATRLIGQKQFVERIGDYTVLTTSINCATPLQAFVKRTLDILGGFAGCVITGILFIFLAPAIYIQSPGPIFFSQIRIGKNGKKFKMYKFRSMYVDAEERKKELLEQNRIKDGMMFKLEWDPRIIGSKKLPDGTAKKGVGNYIRDFSLDEFPQFFNVLKGDMSLVGTRPPTVDEWERYELHHRARLAMKPGITGMWQVSGRSNITDFEEVVKLDTQYISEWSMGLDFRILFKTVGAVFRKEGSM